MFKTLRRSFSTRTQAKATLNRAARCTVESLETRRLLTAWSWQDTQIGLDKEVSNYPNINGTGEAIVVIDSGGVDYNHYALGNGFGNKVVYAWNYDSNAWDVMPYDNNAHGTGVAGEAAGDQHVVNGTLQQGVAPGAKIIDLKATGSWNVKQAFDWVVANRTKYNIVGVNYTDMTGSVDQAQLQGDLSNLSGNGVFVSAPVGNYGPGTAYGTYNHAYYQAGSVNSGDAVSSFTPRGSAVDLVAPGEGVSVVWYSNGQHIDYPSQGTSWSSPQVVGLAALVHQVNPGFTTQQVYSIMHDSAKMVWDGYSNMSYARIDVNAAVALAYARSGSTPTTGGLQGSGGTTPTAATTSTPFGGTPFSVGSIIKAANYDNGGEGVAYHETNNSNEGDQGSYRSGGVDLGWTNSEGGTAYVGWTHAGEYMNYSVNAAGTGTYNLALRVAEAGSGANFHVEVDGKNVSGAVAIPNTGGWNNYSTVTASNISLSAGNHVVRIVMDGNDPWGFAGNFSSMQFTAGSTTPTPVTGGTTTTGYTPTTWTVPNGPFAFGTTAATKSALTVNFYDTADNEAGYQIQRSTSPSSGFSVIATVGVDQATSQGKGWRAWTDTNLSAGTTYYYVVRAINQYGVSSATSGSGTTSWS